MSYVKKGVILIGIFLIGLGIYALVYDQTTVVRREKILEVGPIQATVDRGEIQCNKLPTVFGALVIIAGGALVAMHFARRD